MGSQAPDNTHASYHWPREVGLCAALWKRAPQGLLRRQAAEVQQRLVLVGVVVVGLVLEEVAVVGLVLVEAVEAQQLR